MKKNKKTNRKRTPVIRRGRSAALFADSEGPCANRFGKGALGFGQEPGAPGSSKCSITYIRVGLRMHQ